MALHSVLVTNIGTVYHGLNRRKASKAFQEYKRAAKAEYGRAAGENVYWVADNEMEREFTGRIDRGED